MAVIPTITAIASPDRETRTAAIGYLALAAAMAAVGLPGIWATALRLPSEVTIRALERNQPVEAAAAQAAAARLRKAAQTSNAARSDLALAIMAGDGGIAGDHAVRELRSYLAEVPDDSFAWANLAVAELRRNTPGAAVPPFKMLVELAPASAADLLWRCGFGIDLYPALDGEGRAMLARQFKMALDPVVDSWTTERFITLLQQKSAVPLARMLIADDPEASRRFAGLIAPKP